MPIGATIGAAGLGAVGSIAGGMIQANAADKASQVQAAAADKASQVQQTQFAQTRNDLLPYNQAGQGATNMLMQQLPNLTAPIAPIRMDQAALEQTPGYQFNLSQGLKAVQNGAAARGLGSSGAAMMGAANYATGLADATYQNQFANANTNLQNEMAQRNNTVNYLTGTAGIGANAAAHSGQFGTQAAGNVGQIGTQTAAGIAQNTTNAGTAISAGLNGGANALMGGANNYGSYNLLTGMMQNKGLYGSNNNAPQSYGYGTGTY